MNEWREVSLGDVADLLVGFAYKSSDFTSDSKDTRLLRGVNIGQGFLDWSRAAYWPSADAIGSRYQLAEGDVVLAMDRPWIEAGLKRSRIRAGDLPALLVQRVTRLRGTDAIRTSFIHHLLATERFSRYLQGIVTGATVPHISQTQIESFKLLLPPLAVQDAVCEVLNAMDELMENNRRRVEVLEEMARAIYLEWFVHFRCPGHENATLVDSPLGPIPEGWQVRSVDELASVDKGLSYKGAYLTDDGVPMANLKCLRPGGGFRRDGTKPYSGPYKSRHAVASGDLVMANTDLTQAGTVIGSPAFVPRSGFESGGIISHHLFAIRCDDRARLHWLYESFRDERFRSYARGVASGATVLGFRPADLLAYSLACPPPDAVGRFALVREGLAGLAEDLADANDRLAAIRDLLLPRLVTGQIDVSSLDLDAFVEGSVA